MTTTTTGRALDFITFSRASLATVTDADGKIKWAPHNLLSYSEQFDNTTGWIANAATVAANAVAAPNGTTTADTMTATGSLSSIRQAYTIAGRLTFSVFVRAGTNSSVLLRILAAGNGYDASFTLSGAGTAGTPTIQGTGGTISNMTAAITDIGSSWYLCSVTFTDSSTSNVFIGQSASSGTIHLWGASLTRSDLGGMQANTSAYPLYNPTTAKNLLGFSEDFSNAAWVKLRTNSFGSGSVSNAAIAPNGLQTADFVTEDTTASNSHIVYQAHPNLSANTKYTYSVYVKAGGRNWILLSTYIDRSYQVAFNVAAGTKGTEANATGSIVAVGDGWYRCSITFTVAVAGTGSAYVFLATGDGVTSYTGDGTSGIYLWGAQLSDSASLDPYVASPFAAPVAGAYHGPRRDFDPSSLACRGLLVEEARSNLLLHTAAFDVSATWSPSASGTGVSPVVTANYGLAPDGTMTADRVQLDSGAAGLSQLAQEPGTFVSTSHTFSIWLRSLSGSVTVTLFSLSDVLNVTVTTSWQRFTFPRTISSSTPVSVRIAKRDAWSSSGAADLLVWGAQLEAGSFATSYIPTGASSVTRSADVASVATSAFPYSGTAGTWVVSATTLTAQSGSARYFIANTTGNVFVLYTNNGDTNIRSFDGANVLSSAVSNFAATNKFASAYGGGSKDLCVNGGTVATGTYNGAWSSPDRMFIGSLDSLGSGSLFGHIRQITYIPRRLSNAELQARTV